MTLLQFNTWWLVGHGRSRLVYKSDFKNGQLPLESLLATHEIAYSPKAPDEYRLFILGNSGPWGAALSDNETLSTQLTSLQLHIGKKRLVAYNLAYPNAGIVEEILTLDGALRYQPDLVILFVTGDSFDNSAAGFQNTFRMLNRARMNRLADTFDLRSWLDARVSSSSKWPSWLAIHDEGTLSVWLASLLYPFVPPELGRTGWRIAGDPIPDKPNNFEDVPGIYPLPNEAWRLLQVGHALAETANAKLIVINQPTLVIRDRPQSAVSYSRLYGKAFFDSYRDALSSYTRQNNLWFRDLWDIVPPENYTDSELHIDGPGWAIVASRIAEEIHAQ